MLSPRHLRERARKIKLLLLDVDGVLTDGRIYYLPTRSSAESPNPASQPLFETKTFHSRDGLGMRLARDSGLKLGILSGRGSPVVQYRARELGIQFVEQNVLNKLEVYAKILRAAKLSDDQVCYVGDDIVDLPVLRRVGLAVSVRDSHALLRRHVHYCTRARGGLGAVRETIDLILSAQGKLAPILKQFLR